MDKYLSQATISFRGQNSDENIGMQIVIDAVAPEVGRALESTARQIMQDAFERLEWEIANGAD